MRIGTAILLSIFIGVSAFGIGMFSGWNSGVNDGKNLYQCTTTP